MLLREFRPSPTAREAPVFREGRRGPNGFILAAYLGLRAVEILVAVGGCRSQRIYGRCVFQGVISGRRRSPLSRLRRAGFAAQTMIRWPPKSEYTERLVGAVQSLEQRPVRSTLIV